MGILLRYRFFVLIAISALLHYFYSDGESDLAITDEGEQSSNIQVGLLPNVWGMTLKAPTTGGLDMEARLGLYTHINGGATAGGWNSRLFKKK